MKEIKKNTIVELTENEAQAMYNKMDNKREDIHYLAFDRQLTGFSNLGTFIINNKEIINKESEIIDSIIKKKDVYSLYPKERLTLYPFEKVNDVTYNILVDKIDEYFDDILVLNDEKYETEYLVVDFGHEPNNLKENYELVISHLRKLLKKSKRLKNIYLL